MSRLTFSLSLLLSLISGVFGLCADSYPKWPILPSVAHRGFSAAAPENTLASIRAAIYSGAHGCEMDVRQTSDGALVLSHDVTLERICGLKDQKKIRDYTFEEIRKFDFGAWMGKEFEGELIPTLREALELLRPTSLYAVVEIKENGFEQQLIDLIRELKMEKQTILIDFSASRVKKFRTIAPDIPCAWLVSFSNETDIDEVENTIESTLAECHTNIVDMHFGKVSPELIDRLSAKGIEIMVWTVDDPTMIDRLFDWGIKSVTSNVPNVVYESFKRHRGDNPPGTVIDASRAPKSLFLGAPSMEILPDGTYIASHDWFGLPATPSTAFFESKDRGEHWEKIAEIPAQQAGMLFYVNGALWSIGWMPEKMGDRNKTSITIRRSTDGGHTWTVPEDAKSGLLLDDPETSYFCDPAPVLIYNGRVWKEVERVADRDSNSPRNWATGYQPLMISAPMDADLLDRDSWVFSNPVPWTTTPGLGGWLEGNALADPDGNMLILMRIDDIANCGKAARLNLSSDLKTLSYNPETGFIEMPGGCKKFVIRYDEVSKKYWSLVDWVHPNDADAPNKERIRNTLTLVCSEDLTHWEIRSIIYRHPDRTIGFQYVDWRFVGDDIDFICRLGWVNSPNCHDSDYLTFDRVKNFRSRTREDDAKEF